MLARIEAYYDTVPRANADVDEVGPFTLFVSRGGWPYYARPRLGLASPISAEEVRRVLRRQRDLGVPRSIEWVHETTPTLAAAAGDAGLGMHECPLLALSDLTTPASPVGTTIRVLDARDGRVSAVTAAISRGFGGSGDGTGDGTLVSQLSRGLTRMVGAFDEEGTAVGGGSHNPRGDVTEIVGVAVVPEARRGGIGGAITAALVHDATALGIRTVFCSAGTPEADRVYRSLGFDRAGTAVIAGPTA